MPVITDQSTLPSELSQSCARTQLSTEMRAKPLGSILNFKFLHYLTLSVICTNILLLLNQFLPLESKGTGSARAPDSISAPSQADEDPAPCGGCSTPEGLSMFQFKNYLYACDLRRSLVMLCGGRRCDITHLLTVHLKVKHK
jgi:hypothetical protein